MANPTRFNKIGVAGNSMKSGATDPFLQVMVVPVEETAIGTYSTGVFLPTNAHIVNAFINVIMPETTNVLATVSFGTNVLGAAALVAASVVDTAGFNGALVAKANTTAPNDELTYTIATADLTDAEVELVVEVIGAD